MREQQQEEIIEENKKYQDCVFGNLHFWLLVEKPETNICIENNYKM